MTYSWKCMEGSMPDVKTADENHSVNNLDASQTRHGHRGCVIAIVVVVVVMYNKQSTQDHIIVFNPPSSSSTSNSRF
jgi:hypothetical protein